MAAVKVKLTDVRIKAEPPAAPGKRTTVWDSQVPNFCLRVTDKGHKSFFVA